MKIKFLEVSSSSSYEGKIYNAFIYDKNNEKILDLIPVRIGTTGYMYDKVSRKLFGNSGTGNFILPPGGGDKLILCHFPKKERRVAA